MLSLGLGAAGVVVQILRAVVEYFWGAAPRLQKLQTALAERRTREKAEAAHLEDRVKEIDKAPKKTGKDLSKGLDDALDSFKEKP